MGSGVSSGPLARDIALAPGKGKASRPGRKQELLAQALLVALSPRLPRVESSEPPSGLLPCEDFEFVRQGERGLLAGTWYPAKSDEVRGAVLLVHPWHGRGRAYFYRHRRVPVLRRAGYHVMTFDLGGVGDSAPRPKGFYDSDVRAAIVALGQRAPDMPRHVWGVCLGGYWAHLALCHELDPESEVHGAFFEDTSLHLLEWSHRMAPLGKPMYLFFEHVLRQAYRFLDLRRQAPGLRVRQAAYVSGQLNATVLPEETQELAMAAGYPHKVIADSDHLGCVRRNARAVTGLALRTFELAVAMSDGAKPDGAKSDGGERRR